MFFIRLATSPSTSLLKPPKWSQKASSFLAMASPHAHHFLLSSHPNALLAPPVNILFLQHRRTAETNKGRSKFVGRVSTNLAGRSYIGEGNRCSLQVRAVSVDGDTEKDADVKKPTSYRPVVILPGLGNNTSDYDELVASLAARGIAATVAQVSRPDWLRNAAGLLDASYWKGTLQPRPVLDWYLERMKNAITAAKAMGPEGGKLTVIGHSAGGWLGRVYMADYGTEDIALFLTLGSPHLPPPRDLPGVVDQTRGLLYYCETNFPGAYHAPDVKYVCIAGRYLKGDRLFPGNASMVAPTGLGTVDVANGNTAISAAEASNLEAGVGEVIEDGAVKPAPPTLRARIVGQGYKQVCGQAEVWGDGVVPEVSAHLVGATNLTFDGVYHSPVGASDVRPWYGTNKILDEWIHFLKE